MAIEVTRRQLFPMPREQANNALLWVGDVLRGPDPNGSLKCDDAKQGAAIIGAVNPLGFNFIFNELIKKGFLRGTASIERFDVGMTLEGWDRYEELNRRDTNSKRAFMAMPFGDGRLDRVFECFKTAVGETGFDLQRVIDNQGAGLIDDQIRVGIRRSRFLLCELTGGNQGAYWEAGFAEGIGIPVIYVCERARFENPVTKPHFDTNHCVTVSWSIDDLKDATKRLKATIRATLPLVAKMDDESA
ncbi:MAG TPA: hypothetical protein VMD75_00705 [Candidatus Binataceae bacterium]|nr:hypothetical protein [Candidatus Binataceae bacterium]